MDKLNSTKVHQKLDMNTIFPSEVHSQPFGVKSKSGASAGQAFLISFFGSKTLYLATATSSSSWNYFLRSSITLPHEVMLFDLGQRSSGNDDEGLVIDTQNNVYIINIKLKSNNGSY